MGRGQMPAQQCRSGAWLLWNVLRDTFKTRSWELLGHNWPFCLFLSPTRSWCFASSQPNLWTLPGTVCCQPEDELALLSAWPPLKCGGPQPLLPGGLSGRCWRRGGRLFLLVWLWWWRMSGLVMEAPVRCRRGCGPSLAGISPLLESLVEWNKKC